MTTIPRFISPRSIALYLLGIAILLFSWWYVSPYVESNQLVKAISASDVQTVEEHMDFPTIRAHMSRDLTASMDSEELEIMLPLIHVMLKETWSASSVIEAWSYFAVAAKENSLEVEKIYSLRSPNTFKVMVKDAQSPTGVEFTRFGFTTWKVTRVVGYEL